MKYAFYLSLLFLLFSCSNPPAQPKTAVVSPADQAAIKAVLAGESEAFYQRDFEAWQSYYASDSALTWVCVEEDGVVLEAYSRPFLEAFVGNYLRANPEPLGVMVTRDQFVFRSLEAAVYVSFKEHQHLDDGIKNLMGWRIMKQEQGAWKILAMHSAFVDWTNP